MLQLWLSIQGKEVIKRKRIMLIIVRFTSIH